MLSVLRTTDILYTDLELIATPHSIKMYMYCISTNKFQYNKYHERIESCLKDPVLYIHISVLLVLICSMS